MNRDKEKIFNSLSAHVVECLNAIIDVLPNSIYLKDKNGYYLICNTAMIAKSNLTSKSDIIGKTDFELWPEYAESLCEVDNEVMMENTTVKKTEEVKINTGEILYFNSIKAPLVIAGEISGVIGTSIDITDSKKAADLIIKQQAAEQTIKFTNMVAGSIAHELRTPLSIINLETELANRTLLTEIPQAEKDRVYKKAFKIIKKTIASTAYVINDMLIKIRSFATNGINSDLTTNSILTDIKEFLSSYPFVGDEKKIIQFNLTDAVKNNFNYLGNSILTKHLLSNLLKNSLQAIKEASSGGVIIKLMTNDAEFNKLIFKDTALGIKPEHLAKLFSQFETTHQNTQGTGLGLSFCKMVMSSYGGDIVCRSVFGKYTEFTLLFPKIK